MKQHPLVAASLLVVTLGTAQAAQADDINLDFSLSAHQLSPPPALHHSESSATAIAPASEVADASELSFALPPSPAPAPPQPSEATISAKSPSASPALSTTAPATPVDAASL